MNEEQMRNINPFGLRLQPGLRAKVEAAAKKNRRSLNAEIAARLEASFTEEAQPNPNFGINKEALLAGKTGEQPYSDDVLAQALTRALELIQGTAPAPNKGPSPRKKHPRR